MATLLAFLFLVAPGLLADLLEARRRTGSPESAFREVSRVALFSLVCSLIGALVVGAVLALPSERIGFAPLEAVTDSQYALDNFLWSAAAVIAISAVGCAVAVGIQRLRFGSLRQKIRPGSAWATEFETPRKGKAARSVLQVELLTGERYIGVLAGFSHNIPQDERELSLKQPLWVQRPSSEKPSKIPERYGIIILRGDQVKTIAAPLRDTRTEARSHGKRQTRQQTKLSG
ncbi:DUF6338 family protein [Kocuria dechangensis]|uniref:DUF6338 family protein n=1 Tax=Kocuria dechangensis TaxID=1176249 RepID=UPI001662C39A|nr:DUF6338 family protein [Kocuria dechangensis]